MPQMQLLHDKGREAFAPNIVQKIDDRLKWAKEFCDGETLWT